MKTKVAHASSHRIICEEITIALLMDAKKDINEYREKDLMLDIAEIKKRSANEGIGFFCRTLPNLSKGLLNHLEGNSGIYPNFGKSGKRKYPSFLKGLFACAYDYSSLNHKLAVGAIYQIGNAFKKLKGPYTDEILYSQMQDFVSTDNSLIHDFTECDDMIIDTARSYITEVFKPLITHPELLKENLHPRPGPGATNTPTHAHERYKINTFYESLNNEFDFSEWFYPSYNEFVWDIPRFRTLYSERKAHPIARFKFVDKVVGKARGICIEENEPQYFQQGVKAFLYKWIENHPLTKGKVNFTSQDVNRNIAMSSSSSKEYATLDMSEASDRVSKAIVKKLFEDVPVLQSCLLALATPEVDISSYSNEIGILKLNKYAPMGSGLCFPVMSLVHWSLCRSIIWHSMQRSQLEDVYVYGDDIVVKSPCAQAIFDWLPRFGMKLNVDKSFVKSAFRESCGIHAYQGMDITPVYFKYIPDFPLKIAAVPSIIANEALLYTQGKMCTATYLRKQFGNTLPYVGNSSAAVGWKRPTNDPLIGYSIRERVKCRWNKDLMQNQWKYTVLRQDTDANDASLGLFEEDSALLRWYLVRPEMIHDKGIWNNTPIRRAVKWLTHSEIYGKSVDLCTAHADYAQIYKIKTCISEYLCI